MLVIDILVLSYISKLQAFSKCALFYLPLMENSMCLSRTLKYRIRKSEYVGTFINYYASLLCDISFKVACGVNFFESVFPLHFFYFTIWPIKSIYCLKGFLMRNSLDIANLPSQQIVKLWG